MFSSTQMDNGGNFSSSQAKSRDGQPMVPVTVKQISDAVPSSSDKATFTIDGVDVKNVVMVGMAFEKSMKKKTNMSFMLDDGTGRIPCLRWMNDTFDTNEVDAFSDGVYVRVHGILKEFQGKVQVEALAVRLVINFDEVSCHLLTCLHYHTYITKKNGINVSTQAPSVPSANTPLSVPQKSSADQVSGQFSANGHKDIDEMVIDYLEESSRLVPDKGLNVNDIATHLKLPLEKIRTAIKCLEEEGRIYSTIDDDHYKSTS